MECNVIATYPDAGYTWFSRSNLAMYLANMIVFVVLWIVLRSRASKFANEFRPLHNHFRYNCNASNNQITDDNYSGRCWLLDGDAFFYRVHQFAKSRAFVYKIRHTIECVPFSTNDFTLGLLQSILRKFRNRFTIVHLLSYQVNFDA